MLAVRGQRAGGPAASGILGPPGSSWRRFAIGGFPRRGWGGAMLAYQQTTADVSSYTAMGGPGPSSPTRLPGRGDLDRRRHQRRDHRGGRHRLHAWSTRGVPLWIYVPAHRPAADRTGPSWALAEASPARPWRSVAPWAAVAAAVLPPRRHPAWASTTAAHQRGFLLIPPPSSSTPRESSGRCRASSRSLRERFTARRSPGADRGTRRGRRGRRAWLGRRAGKRRGRLSAASRTGWPARLLTVPPA